MGENEICPVCEGKGLIPDPRGKSLIPWWLSPLGWLLSKNDNQICPICDGTGTIPFIIKERNRTNALETAYLLLLQNQDNSAKGGYLIDGFGEKNKIIDVVMYCYKLPEKESEEIYFQALKKIEEQYRIKD